MKRVAVLISGAGRNLQAIIEAVRNGRIDAELVGVISSKADVQGLERAREAGISTQVLLGAEFPDRVAYDQALDVRLRALSPDLVVLAGFMRVLTREFVEAWSGRLVNIHPSLLPAHPGLRTHERVLAAGDAEHGATVHFVSVEVDAGPRLIQGAVRVHADDTAATLADRVMSDVETRIYPQAIAWLVRDELQWVPEGLRFRGKVLERPLGLNDLEPEFR